MSDFARRTFLRGLGATLMLGPAAFRARAARAADGAEHPDLVKINGAHLIGAEEARAVACGKGCPRRADVFGQPFVAELCGAG